MAVVLCKFLFCCFACYFVVFVVFLFVVFCVIRDPGKRKLLELITRDKSDESVRHLRSACFGGRHFARSVPSVTEI